MDDLVLINRIQKLLKENYNQVANVMVGGGVDSMEKYKYMLGQAQAYTFISGEISNLLNKGAKNEDNNGTVINLDGKDRDPKA
jgi:heptaprenylglyceryl phosphate synthase